MWKKWHVLEDISDSLLIGMLSLQNFSDVVLGNRNHLTSYASCMSKLISVDTIFVLLFPSELSGSTFVTSIDWWWRWLIDRRWCYLVERCRSNLVDLCLANRCARLVWTNSCCGSPWIFIWNSWIVVWDAVLLRKQVVCSIGQLKNISYVISRYL